MPNDYERLSRLIDSCADRAWRLAFGLLSHHEDAFDAVQQACLVAARKVDKIPRVNPWPWFSGVVANETRNLRRKRQRQQTNAEAPIAESLAPQPTPEQELMSDEDYQALWRAIDSLPEHERDAIIMTKVAGMSHAAAAESLGIREKTLSSHVSRGTNRLKERLKRDERGLMMTLAAIPVSMPPGGMEGALLAWKGSAIGALTATGTTTTILGGILAMKQGVVATSVAIGLGVGLVSGYFAHDVVDVQDERTQSNTESSLGSNELTDPDSKAASSEPVTSAKNTPAPNRELEDELKRIRNERDQFANNNKELAATIESLRDNERRLEDELKNYVADAAAQKPVFDFGAYGNLPGVREEDWGKRGEASQNVDEAIIERYETRKRGERPTQENGVKLQRNVERMRLYEYEVLGKLPSHARYNGENLHPVTQANLIAAQLNNVNMALNETQIQRISALGVEYESAWNAKDSSYPSGTARAQKILDEMQLKKAFMDGLYAQLSMDQLEYISPADYRYRAGLDLNCPTLLIFNTSPAVSGKTREEIAEKVASVLARLRIPSDQLARPEAKTAIDAWLTSSEVVMGPIAPVDVRHYSYAQAIAAGRATVTLLTTLRDELELSEETKEALGDEPNFLLARLVSVPEDASGD